jgi:hypothetical protein
VAPEHPRALGQLVAALSSLGIGGSSTQQLPPVVASAPHQRGRQAGSVCAAAAGMAETRALMDRCVEYTDVHMRHASALGSSSSPVHGKATLKCWLAGFATAAAAAAAAAAATAAATADAAAAGSHTALLVRKGVGLAKAPIA